MLIVFFQASSVTPFTEAPTQLTQGCIPESISRYHIGKFIIYLTLCGTWSFQTSMLLPISPTYFTFLTNSFANLKFVKEVFQDLDFTH